VLGWGRAYVVGHSWGGHLALHVAEAMPERLFGVLAVDPLGSVGDGRWPEFDEEILRRTPESVRERAREIDELSTAGAAGRYQPPGALATFPPARTSDVRLSGLRSDVEMPVP
jgi:pimeloyl-ACP methyl ester carboxylesterase